MNKEIINFILKKIKSPCFFPFYHVVSNENLAHIKQLYRYKNEKEFINDIKFFAKNFEFVDVDFFSTPRKTKKPPIHISFDDGLSEIATVVAPILKKYSIPASFFINSSFVDNKKLFFRFKESLIIEKLEKVSETTKKEIIKIIKNPTNNLNQEILKIEYKEENILNQIAEILDLSFEDYLKTKKPYLSLQELQNLEKQGFRIGGHGVNHQIFFNLTQNEQIKEISESMNYIKNNFKQDIKIFAFPFSDYLVSNNFFEEIKEKEIVDFSFGTAGFKLDSCNFNLQRLPIENPFDSAEKRIFSETMRFIAKILIGKEKINRNKWNSKHLQ